jgi:hypothetical protein
MAGYGWQQTLTEELPIAGTVAIPAAGVEDPKNNLETYQVAVDAYVVSQDKAPVVFDTTAKTATITNNTLSAWPGGTDIYIMVTSTTAVEALGGADERLTDLEASVADLDARVAALEAAGSPAGRTGAGSPDEPRKPEYGREGQRQDQGVRTPGRQDPEPERGKPGYDPKRR